MTTLRWLQLNRPCILEIPQLKDYAGQSLVFREPMFKTRCVTEEVFTNPLIESYKAQLLLIEVNSNGTVPVPAAAPAMPAVVKPMRNSETAKTVETLAVTAEPVKEPEAPPPEPEVVETPAPPPEPEVVETPAPPPEPETTPSVIPPAADAPASVSTEEAPAKDSDEPKGSFELKRRRRS